jgi:hypothetical protein
MKNFAEGLGISKERVKQIGEMAMQTFETGRDMAINLDKTGGTYDNMFDSMTQLQKEDIKLLASIEEGIIYGYAIGELVSEIRDYIGSITVVSLDDLLAGKMKKNKGKKE